MLRHKKIGNIPVYGIIIGMLLLAIMQLCYYNIGIWFGDHVNHAQHVWKIPAIDDAIPIIPIFIIPYAFSYVFWLIGLIAASKNDIDFYCDWVIGSLIALTAGLIFFCAYPTIINRFDENLYIRAGQGILSDGIRFFYDHDGVEIGRNLAPSYHCLTSCLCFLATFRKKVFSRPFRVYTALMSVLIYCSTVFVKQHYVIDIPFGILLAVGGVAISQRYHLGKKLKNFIMS